MDADQENNLDEEIKSSKFQLFNYIQKRIFFVDIIAAYLISHCVFNSYADNFIGVLVTPFAALMVIPFFHLLSAIICYPFFYFKKHSNSIFKSQSYWKWVNRIHFYYVLIAAISTALQCATSV